jgi:outer membrane lipoprotein-sorting protein
MKTHAFIFLLCFLIFATASAQEHELKPAEIVSQPKAAYRECKTYRDTGFLTAWLFTDSGSSREDYVFSTVMQKDGAFRFEFGVPGIPKSAYVVWENNSEAFVWHGLRQEKSRLASGASGLAQASGISHGLSTSVPPLLIGNEVVRGVFDLTDLVRGKDGYMNGQPCFELTGKSPGDTTTIWIDQKTYLIRSIEENSSDGESKTVITYFPQINESIDAELLRLDRTK